jgi:hypothetical protein
VSRRRARSAALVAPGLAVLLAACGSPTRQVSEPAADRAAHPVVAVGQAGSVLNAVEAALVRGVDPKQSAVDARLVGPYRELALAGARIAAARKARPAPPSRVEPARLIVPADRSWPRFFVEAAKGSQSSTYVLRVLSSATPRTPYGLWAEPTLLPGVTLPATAAATTGSVVVAPDTPGLVATPREVLSKYASYLNDGARTTTSRPFRRSIFSDQLLQVLGQERSKLKAVATVSSKHSTTGTDPFAVRTLDGGALVIGRLQQEHVVTVKKGKGTVRYKDQNLAALAGGKKEFTKQITRTAVEVLVFHVPPAGQGEITVIAAQKGDVKAIAR